MSDLNSDVLDWVIRQATFAADSAVIDASRTGELKVPADATAVAVRAAIRNAIGNGALQLTPHAGDIGMWRISGDPDTWADDINGSS